MKEPIISTDGTIEYGFIQDMTISPNIKPRGNAKQKRKWKNITVTLEVFFTENVLAALQARLKAAVVERITDNLIRIKKQLKVKYVRKSSSQHKSKRS